MKSGKILGVISIKGGVGKTTVVSNLGATLANKFEKKVLLVDGNITAPNLGLHLGVTDTNESLHDVLFNQMSVKKAIRSSEFGFDILPSALVPKKDQKTRINPYKLHNRLAPLKEEYDYIIIDSSPNLNEEILSTMIAADELLVVTSPDYPTLSCTMNAIKVANERKTPISGLVLNKVRNKKFELSIKDIEETTGVPVLSVITDDVKILEALAATAPASLHAPRKKFSAAYTDLGSKITGEQTRRRSGLLSVFKK